MVARGTLTTAAAGTPVSLAPGETAVLTLSVAAEEAFEGVAILETSRDQGQTWQPYAHYIGTAETPLTLTVAGAAPGKNTSDRFALVRVRVDSIAEGSDGITYCLTTLSAPGVEPQRVTTNPEEYEAVDLTVYETRVQTSGSQGDEELVLGVVDNVRVGTRHLVVLEKKGHAADNLVLDEGDILADDGSAVTAVEMGTAGDWILFECDGVAWRVVYSKAGVTITKQGA